MHYYNFNIADYRKDTGHLTLIEHAIYRQLIDWYYMDEKPIPNDTNWFVRRFQVPYEQVETILVEFFDLQEDGWHHGRCDLEIQRFTELIAIASKAGKASAAKRAGKKETSTPVQHEDNDISTTVQRPFNQPITKNQEPNVNINTLSGSPDVQSRSEEKKDANEVLSFLNLKANRKYKPVPANIKLIAARLREGASVAECRQVIAKKCREWGTDEKMAEYLRPATLFNATKFAQYIGELGND